MSAFFRATALLVAPGRSPICLPVTFFALESLRHLLGRRKSKILTAYRHGVKYDADKTT